MKTFLEFLDPTTQHVGLAVLPPIPSGGNACTAPAHHNTAAANTAYKTNSKYLVVPLSSDYSDKGKLKSSPLVDAINCVKGNGFTAYATALEKAQLELETNGRSDVQNVIVFLSDGAANIGPSDLPLSSDYRKRPCRQGVNSAATIKAKGTLIYSIGYDLNALVAAARTCARRRRPTAHRATRRVRRSPLTRRCSRSRRPERCPSPATRTAASTTSRRPASSASIFDLEIAVDLEEGSSALIDNDRT